MILNPTAPLNTLPDQVARQLRGELLSGRFQAGEALREVSLAGQFGVGRTIIRQVFGRLVQEGLLIGKYNCGVTVAGTPSEEVRELLTPLRQHIEAYALTRCLDQLTEADFAEWSALLGQLRLACEQHNFAATLDADFEFHRFILLRAGLHDLIPVWQPILTRLRPHHEVGNRRYPNDRLLVVHAIHEELLKVFRHGTRKQALAALASHIADGSFNRAIKRRWLARKSKRA
jgi:DNA-binding GntR family transcriptional regulator